MVNSLWIGILIDHIIVMFGLLNILTRLHGREYTKSVLTFLFSSNSLYNMITFLSDGRGYVTSLFNKVSKLHIEFIAFQIFYYNRVICSAGWFINTCHSFCIKVCIPGKTCFISSIIVRIWIYQHIAYR